LVANSFTLEIKTSEEFSNNELDKLTRQLRDELIRLDVEAIERVNGEVAPASTRAETMVLRPDALTVTLMPDVILSTISAIQHWLQRQQRYIDP